MPNETTTGRWSDWDAENAGFRAEAGVGLCLSYPDNADSAWLSWDETVSLHAWLSQIIESAKNG